jgi:phosphoribosylglycinamide formyltransferase-1
MSGGTKGFTKPRVAVFASGGGSTFRAVAEAIAEGLVDFTINLVLTDHPDAGILQQVAEVNKLYDFDIKTEIVNKKRFPGGEQGRGQTMEEAEATLTFLKQHKIDHLSLLGLLRIVATQVIEEYGWKPEYTKRDPKHKGAYLARMTNTHCGILPATIDTYGIHIQERILERGLTESAHTVHVVALGIDKGPVVAEHRIRVFPASKYPAAIVDTPEKLFARVRQVEQANIAFDIDAFLKDQARWRLEQA